MRRKIYRSAAIAMVIACLLFVFFTWYVVGIIEKSNTKEILEERVLHICEMFTEKQNEYEEIIDTVCNEYKLRSRSLAMLLSRNESIIDDDMLLEEVRMAIGAVDVTIFDENLQVEHATGTIDVNEEVLEKFKPAIDNKQFSMAEIDHSENVSKIIVGVSRVDKPGIVQVEYTSGNINSIFELLDLSEIFMNITVMKTGSFAIIENSDMTYSAHTDKNMVGKPSHFDMENDFSDEEGFFNHEINGENSLVYYKWLENQVVLGYIPYSEIYNVRNDTMKWVAAAGAIISIVVMLTIRNGILRINKKEKKRQ